MIFSSASFLRASPLRSDLGWFGSSMRCAKTLTTVTRLPDTGVRPDCANAARDRETESERARERESERARERESEGARERESGRARERESERTGETFIFSVS